MSTDIFASRHAILRQDEILEVDLIFSRVFIISFLFYDGRFGQKDWLETIKGKFWLSNQNFSQPDLKFLENNSLVSNIYEKHK